MNASLRRRPRSAGLRLLAGLAMLVAGVAMFAVAPTAGAEDGPDDISVVQTPAPDQGVCVPYALALNNGTLTAVAQSTPESFKLIITGTAPLCDPVQVHAVIYSMPGNGVAWPQTLAQKETFTIGPAGTTEVTFMKGCEPEQYDVLTGDTPEVISPEGTWHGPLLFPTDTSTSEQYWGNPELCRTTTTTTTTTLVPVSVLPTSTVPTQVEGVTTTVVSPQNVAVAGANETARAGAQLAFSGSSATIMGLIGGALVLGGLGMVLVARRREV